MQYFRNKIASIEEYEAGYNAFDDGDMVRAATVGEKDIDKTPRTANIKHPKIYQFQSRRYHYFKQ